MVEAITAYFHLLPLDSLAIFLLLCAHTTTLTKHTTLTVTLSCGLPSTKH